jgi:hypothetical protein
MHAFARHWRDVEQRKVEDEPIPRFPRCQERWAATPRERGNHHRGLVKGHKGGAVAAAGVRSHDDTSGEQQPHWTPFSPKSKARGVGNEVALEEA